MRRERSGPLKAKEEGRKEEFIFFVNHSSDHAMNFGIGTNIWFLFLSSC
jgi:hypothetical protein